MPRPLKNARRYDTSIWDGLIVTRRVPLDANLNAASLRLGLRHCLCLQTLHGLDRRPVNDACNCSRGY